MPKGLGGEPLSGRNVLYDLPVNEIAFGPTQENPLRKMDSASLL